MFVNPEIPPDALPRAESVDWHPLHPDFVRCLQAKALVRMPVFIAIAGVGHALVVNVPAFSQGGWIFPWAWLLLLVPALWSLAWPVVAVPRRGYAVRDRDILYKTGILWRTQTAVPYNRVQHAETASGPMDRRFGLGRLTVFTAGTTGGDLRIEGLGEDVAERLRVYIVGKLRGQGERMDTAVEEGAADVEHA